MVLLDEYRQQLTAAIAALKQVNPFDLAGLAKEKQELEEQMAQDGFWNDVENANKVNQRIKAIHAKLDKYRKLETTGEDVSTLFDMAEEEDDEETALEAQAELKDFLHKVEEFRIDTMLRGPYDNAFMPVQAARKRRIGSACSTACTHVIANAKVLL